MTGRRFLLACLLVSGSACLWRSYEDIMRVHVEVLSAMIDKVVERSEEGRRPEPNDVTELLYPLRRARQFAHQYRDRSESESYRAFEVLLARYERLVQEIDSARVDEDRWNRLEARLADERAALGAEVRAVRAALEREG